jgi:major membrane immunogen (membrane-anchored lipoprotein)
MRTILKSLNLLLAFGLILPLLCIGQETKTVLREGRSQSVYTNEPYVAIVRITTTGKQITDVTFEIVDTLNNEQFGSDYEKHYPNNELYRQQCRNDWQGVLNYPKQLVEKQRLSKVDCITGATWSYNMFKAAATEAMKTK